MSLKALLPNLSYEDGVGWGTWQFLVPTTESFNYMEFALGWAISIFYVDALPPQHAFIHSHSQEGALTKNRLSSHVRCCIIASVSEKKIDHRGDRMSNMRNAQLLLAWVPAELKEALRLL